LENKQIQDLENEIEALYKDFYKLGHRDTGEKLKVLHKIAGLKYTVSKLKLKELDNANPTNI
jgi:hypothetical protein